MTLVSVIIHKNQLSQWLQILDILNWSVPTMATFLFVIIRQRTLVISL